MNPPPPLGDDARERVLREMRLKEQAHDEGRREGRVEAAAQFERRLDEMERKVKALWDAFCREPTQRIERSDEEHA
jgi:hypothetical protein